MLPTPPLTDESDDVQASIEHNNRKLTADKIISILTQVRNDKAKSNRRWIWELMQNAKDLPVPEAWGGVSVEIEHRADRLIFRHNADPFRVADLTGLIQQVSSKDSNNSDAGITGKFGTGFISTHLLSAEIWVAGVVKRPHLGQHRRFRLLLDRSGDSSEALLGKLSTALDQVLRLDQDPSFELLPNYLAERTEADLDTSFTYELATPDSQESARVGLADLVHTLPATLVNLPKIKQVRVLMPDGAEQTYRRVTLREASEAEPVAHYQVVQTDSRQPAGLPARCFVAYEIEEVLRLLAEVRDFTSWALVPGTGQQPMLYRDFPLIGSEKFYYPFTLNGYGFFPNEKRDSVFLNGTEGVFKANRDLLETAQTAALAFTDWLVAQGARHRYVLATTRLPDTDLDDDAKRWYRGQQRSWRAALLSKPLVETAAGPAATLAAVRIPRFAAVASKENEEANAELYGLVADYLGPQQVPHPDLLEPWIAALGIEGELGTWGEQPLFINVEELLALVAKAEGLTALPPSVAASGNAAAGLAWLNRLYAFLAKHKKLDLLKAHAAVPNQEGKLKKLDDLWVEKTGELIPAPVLDVLHKLGLPWRADLLPRDVQLPDYTHQDRGLSDASKEINRLLLHEEKVGALVKSDFLSRPDAQQVLVALLRLTTTEARDTTYRSRLFGYAQQLLHLAEAPLPVDSLEGLFLGNAARLMTRLLNGKIESSKTLAGLGAVLRGADTVPGDDANRGRVWLNGYLQFLSKSDEYKYLLEVGNIVPNRLGTLCAYEALYNYGVPGGQALDDELLAILQQFDGNKQWQPRLLAAGIDLVLPRVYKMEELGNDLTQEAEQVVRNKAHQRYREPLLNLIEWCENHDKLARHYLGLFVDDSGGIFYELTIEKGEKSRHVMKLLRRPENLRDLVAIADAVADSDINLSKVLKLVEMAPSDALLNKALAFVEEQQIQDAETASNFAIGHKMEKLFEEALKTENIPATIKYQGKGDCDYLILNTANEKCFYLEVKAYAEGSKAYPLRVALSQARLAVTQPARFALCVVPHPPDLNSIDTDYVKQELAYVPGLTGGFDQVIQDWEKLRTLSDQANQEVGLEVAIEKPKVRVSHSFVDARRKTFVDLIADILLAVR